MFRRTATLLGLAFVTFGATQVQAQDWNFYYGRTPGCTSSHRVLHRDLSANGYERQVDHAIAHQSPLTYGEHNRLHQALDYERAVDGAEHRNYHRTYGSGYYPGYSGGYYTRSNPSGVYFGNRRTQIFVGW